jgi:apolipoprotein N-acyltransferase
MARSANSGPSSVIDHRGRVLAKTAQFEEATLAYALQPQTGDTAFKRYGNWIVWLCIAVLLLVCIRNKGYSKQ